LIKRFSLLIPLAVLFLSSHAFAQCPCDTETLSNGLSGNEIVEILCPGGNLGEDTNAGIEPGLVIISLDGPPSTTYLTRENNVGDKFCEINTDGVFPETLQITDDQFLLCSVSLVERCGLSTTTNIPTLSEWGLIAMTGLLAIIGAVALRRRRAAA
jgi:hypothetical protein